MTKKLELYRCNVCGNLVEVLLTGAGELVCCGQNMELLQPKNSADDNMLTEKHSPVITFTEDNKREIRVAEHPMENEHYIMFIECVSADKNEAKIKYFYPHEQAVMTSDMMDESLWARSYCNVHGLYNDNKQEG